MEKLLKARAGLSLFQTAKKPVAEAKPGLIGLCNQSAISSSRETLAPLSGCRFKFQKRSQLLIRTNDKTLSVVAVRVTDPDC
jgi:hypothetical protein